MQISNSTLEPHTAKLIQTEQATKAGIAIQKYGAILIPSSASSANLVLSAEINGTVYNASSSATINASNNVGDTVELTKVG